MGTERRLRVDWGVLLILGPIILIGILISALRPPAFRLYIIIVGIVAIVALTVYAAFRHRGRRSGQQP